MEKHYITKNKTETRKLAKKFASELLINGVKNKAFVIGFVGELGAGKTTFIQSFIRALGVRNKITSPTFLILRRFSMPRDAAFRNVFHIDAFRAGAGDILALGIKDIFRDPVNIVLVEWADRIRDIMPDSATWVIMEHGEEKERHITFN